MGRNDTYDLVIIGGGPAGITAGIYAVRENLKTVLITKDFLGELSHAFIVENYPGFEEIRGLELIRRLKKHLDKFLDDKIEGRQVIEITKEGDMFKIECDDHSVYWAKSVIIATGGMSRRLEIPGENEFVGKGVSYCPTCDGFLFRGKTIAVAGGGNSGVIAAIYLSKIAKKVYLFESRDGLSASKIYHKQIQNLPNVEVLFSSKIKEIIGKEKLEKIVVDIGGEEREFLIDGLFVQIGYVPVSDFSEKVVKTDKYGQIIVNPLTLETNCRGIFAVGDVNNTLYKQIIIAAGQGATAALSASEFLRESQSK